MLNSYRNAKETSQDGKMYIYMYVYIFNEIC